MNGGACAQCGGRLRLIATIEDPAIVDRILRHIGLPTDLPDLLPARSPPAVEATLTCAAARTLLHLRGVGVDH
jgi:hypothetical protein